MTSTPVSNLAQPHQQPIFISKTGKLWIAVIGLLIVAFHWPLLSKMAKIALDDPNWSHMLIIPFISIYYIHLNRQKLMATPRRVCRWGLPFILFGVTGYVLGIFPIKNDMAMGYSMIMTIFGIALLLLGPAMMRTLWFPIAFLVFGIKISPAIWSVISGKMQGFAATGSYYILDMTSILTGMDVTLKGSTLHLDYGQVGGATPMNVAEACGGMRMLMAFLALGVALAFLFPRAWWQRFIMVALAAPIAIFVNALRVAVLGWLHLIDPALAHGDFHIFVGMLMLIPAAGLLMLVGWCLDKMLIVEGKPKPPAPLGWEQDPQEIHLHPARLVRGVAIGGVLMVLLGLSYVLFINNRAAGEVITSISLGLNNTLLIASGVLMLAGLVFAWRSIQKSQASDQVALSQGIIGGLLVVAILGQTSVINATGVALNKLPLPLRHGIALSFPDQAGDWELLHQDPKLPKDIEDELGTDEYFNRYYVNNAEGVYKDSMNVKTQDNEPGGRLIGWEGLGNDKVGGLAKVHVTYYTGMLDTVPHVPDKCWLAGGSKQIYRKAHTLELARDDYRPDPDHPGMVLAESTGFEETVRLPGDKIEAIIFSGQDLEGRVTTALYFFLVNGKAMASNHEVRFGFNMRDRYSYYCKVEVLFPGVTDPDELELHAEKLISNLLPEVMACLPDWTEVLSGDYPETP